MRVSWTTKKTKEWVLKAGVKRELLDKARKLAYYCHTIRKRGSCLEKEIMQAIMHVTMPGAGTRGRGD